ncbi:MAG: triose-phosphate isomerase, partial [Dialister micraerophilus]
KFGAFTGEISPIMLSELGCSYVICGHSERRDIFNENNEIIAKKVLSIIDEKMTPILCVGENEKDIKEGKALLKIKTQIESVFSKISKNEKIIPVVAYEPVWAIGTGKSATPEYAQKIAQNIRNYIANIHGETYAESVRILYGGSVNSLNISDFIKEKDIDGALIGGASLDTAKFKEIYNKVILTQGV